MNPARLVFCGGGTRCIVFVHTLIELEKGGHLRNVREYWGTSAGALIASLLAVSKSATKLRDLIRDIDYTKFRDMDVSNLLSITSTWGLDDGHSLTREIERIFETIESGASLKTLSDVPGLNIVVSDLTIRETVVCNATKYPRLRIVDALRASMSLPMFYRPYIHPETGHYWVDGAIRANFPWMLLPSDEARRESLGFAFDKTIDTSPKTFMDYIFSMVHFDEPKKFRFLKEHWTSNILFFPPPPFPSWFVRLREEDFTMMEAAGASMLTANPQVCASQTSEIPPLSVRLHIPSFSPPGHIGEPSDTHLPSRVLTPDSSQPQSHYIPPVSRRWSL